VLKFVANSVVVLLVVCSNMQDLPQTKLQEEIAQKLIHRAKVNQQVTSDPWYDHCAGSMSLRCVGRWLELTFCIVAG
jgi:hypothetical protein